MLVLVSGTTKTVARLAGDWPNHLGHLITPKNRNSVRSLLKTGLPWAIDNGAFGGFDAVAFERTLARAVGAPRLLWVVCPDRVADARETLRLFEEWQPKIKAPLAFVGQDGAEDTEIPWSRFACFFIGGSTEWKLSEHAGVLAAEAKQRGKMVHMGRVNSRRRLQTAIDMGCDSVDGSSLSMFGDKYIHKFCSWVRQLECQPTLFRI